MPTVQEIARDEAYASAPVDKPIRSVIELDNAAFDTPLYFIEGVEDDTPIVLEDGTSVTAIACAFSYTPPGSDKGGPTLAKLSVDNVSGRIVPYLRQATSAISVTYRGYVGGDYTDVVDLIEGLQLKRVSVGGASAQGDLTFVEIATQAFPRRTYDLATYPALWIS